MELVGIERAFRRWGIDLDMTDVVAGHPRGAFNPDFVMLHHDAGRWKRSNGTVVPAPSHTLIRQGRPDVPPPLYHLYVTRDLTVELVTRGRANHAGKGGPWRSLGTDEGNRRSIGVCLAHMGQAVGNAPQEPLRPEVLSLAARVTAACCDYLGIDADHVLAHWEYTPRKPDPYGIAMVSFRARVGELLAAGPAGVDDGGTPTPTPGGDMITGAQLLDLLKTTELGLGPANARILGQPDRDITLEGLLVALVGHTAAQTATLGEVRGLLERLVRQTAPVDLEPVAGNVGVMLGEQQSAPTAGGFAVEGPPGALSEPLEAPEPAEGPEDGPR